MTIPPDTFVRLRTDPSKAGIVVAGGSVLAGIAMVPVRFSDGKVRQLPAEALEPVPSSPQSPVELVRTGAFSAPDHLRHALARIRVSGHLEDMVYSMEAADIDFYAHQFKPVIKLLNAPRDALLIADEVGLGKTIEAGLIWTELRARLEARRLLVLCPKTLRQKWKDELDHRFGADARIVSADDLLELLTSTRHQQRGFVAIAGMQALRPPRGWKDSETDEDADASPTTRLAKFLESATDGDPLLDLLVIDEAHHMRNRNTLLYQLGELINGIASHRVFLSATPIHLRNSDLYSLLRLIDPDTFEFEQTLDRMIQANAPIVKARDLVLMPSSTSAEIISLIEEAQEDDLLSSSRALELLRNDVEGMHLDKAARAEIAARLERSNQLANFLTRTRRRDVEGLRVPRVPTAPHLEMHEDERLFYSQISQDVAEYAATRSANERFFLSTAQRLLTSSPAAAAEWWESRYDADEIEEYEDDEESAIDDADPGPGPLTALLGRRARELGMSSRLRQVDTKLTLLLQELGTLWQSEPTAKIVLFSSFKPTLRYLQERLAAKGFPTELLHGSVSEPRDRILKRFRERPDGCVLLSSEVGSEGIDLQFCWIVINYDLPWNPMRLEQRIGRVDRLGQKRDSVRIINLVYSDTIDDRIYHRLYERLQRGQMALGEFESVLGEPIRQMTVKLLDSGLDENQKLAVIDQTAQALENKALEEKQLEEEAGSLLSHGDYILQRIRETRERHRWLGSDDILVYVRERLERSFPGCLIQAISPGSDICRIRLSPEAHEAFLEFANRNSLNGTTRLPYADESQRYRFTSSILRSSEARVENISQIHPLVKFCADIDGRDEELQRPQIVSATLSRDAFGFNCAPGSYIIAVQLWTMADATGRTRGMQRLAYAGGRLDDGTLLPSHIAEELALAAAQGRPIPNLSVDDRTGPAARLLERVVGPALDKDFARHMDQIRADLQDRSAIRLQALDRHLDNKRFSLNGLRTTYVERQRRAHANGDQSAVRKNTRLISLIDGQLARLGERVNARRREIDMQSRITPELMDVACVLVEIG